MSNGDLKQTQKHPSETDLALLAGGDCGRVRRFLLKRHVAKCGDCRDALASFSEVRSAVRQSEVPDLNWDLVASEMRANIRVGLAAGECVREVPAATSLRGWKPQLAIGLTSVLLLAGVGVFLRGLLPHETATSAASAAILESTGDGVRVQNGSGNSMTLLHRDGAVGDQTVTSQGGIRARYVDGNTGTVTITSVYEE